MTEHMDEAEFQLLYGRWQPLTPPELRDLFADAPFRWWIAGGWAIELSTGVQRHHDDTDVVVLFDDLPKIRAWLAGYHLWEAHDGALRPLLPGEELREAREQLWARRNASEPWLMDLLLSPFEDGRWIYKRDRRVSLPLDELGALSDDVWCLRPEVVLLHKAKATRDKDEADFASALPLLEERERAWLDEALALAHPDHPWRARLSSDS
jgi:hypothetical protein